jgi:hypothetical protein
MQLVAGRTGQEFNRRENRKGAFWEDRYHATIVQTNQHLLSCMVYIDLNMVRAGVVRHPGEWVDGGYSEMQKNEGGALVIDREARKNVLGFDDVLDESYQKAISDRLQNQFQTRESMWTDSIAVGDEAYIVETKKKLSLMAKGRTPVQYGDAYMLRETVSTYGPDAQMDIGNTYDWDINIEESDS